MLVLTDRDKEMVNRLRRIFTPFECGGKSAKSKYFGQVRHVLTHIWSSPGKSADTHCAMSQKPDLPRAPGLPTSREKGRISFFCRLR